MPEAEGVEIGRLRWRVLLATREQYAQMNGGAGIDEVLEDLQPVQADVQPVGAMTFWGLAGEQVDGPITHRIFIRWVDYLDNKQVVIRRSKRRDGTARTELFRVRRVREITGRKRFVILEVELEKAT
ncbi:hypothetical protein HN018_06870 [Lichenicola cladoniae]|uniref:Uncharacterized protein n=1 Tax=Lichenicola cladoniae TaxID=1484109 RepID=A0A6M8HN52_9PROT|nr:head-tail adaptor protein [Lichenicola cladoniae]NPD67295.1 hypothetical protein [Acetobacteraceae bacterium]QKE89798.1 hypothetical protein HN018_06870 [Lichenicola cladoniae]